MVLSRRVIVAIVRGRTRRLDRRFVPVLNGAGLRRFVGGRVERPDLVCDDVGPRYRELNACADAVACGEPTPAECPEEPEIVDSCVCVGLTGTELTDCGEERAVLGEAIENCFCGDCL